MVLSLYVPAVVNKEVSYEDAYYRSQAEVRKCLPLAKELGIKILFENVWNNFLLSPVEMARYIDEFESPWVGSYFDVGNIVNHGWPEHWIRTLGSRIGKLDIKEFSRKIAEEKMPDLNCFTVESAMSMVAGSAKSAGFTMDGPAPWEKK